jgi:hypothetical protein
MKTTTMEQFTLPRTGDRPLAFVGERITTASSRAVEGPAEHRWWVVSIYRTQGGAYVGAVNFETTYETREKPTAHAWAAPTTDALAEILRAHPFLTWASLYPPNHGKREWQERTLRLAWEAALESVLGALGPEVVP